ncbi:hypothetical protein ZOSMA_231G00070 [Zostera marina]|uniref:Jacalin-type lectin domain-containing protein n=1 Tax=Zostera marina TaxID=29655 RepID=A0A0K9PI86_ZOSMR|nr:hypothetical protein ZOSMA_231G00070 [Zostera marina]
MKSWKRSYSFQLFLLAVGWFVGLYVSKLWMKLTVLCVVVIFSFVEFYILMRRNKSSLLPIRSSHANSVFSNLRMFVSKVFEKIFNKKVKVDMDGILIKGPFGKYSGNNFIYNGYDGNIKLYIRSEKVVDSIGFLFTNVGEYKFHRIGGEVGVSTPDELKKGMLHKIKLQRGEEITEVQGAYGSWFDSRVIVYITFRTSKERKFGPYGSDPNSKIIDSEIKILGHFHEFNCGKLVGIFGQGTGYFVNSIGFYFQK